MRLIRGGQVSLDLTEVGVLVAIVAGLAGVFFGLVGILTGVVGTVLAGYTTYVTWQQNREHIVVRLSLGRLSTSPDKTILIIDAVNDGALPIMLTSYGLRLPDHPLDTERNMRLPVYDWTLAPSAQIPCVIEPRARCVLLVDAEPVARSLQSELGIRGRVRLVAYVDDALGRQWKSNTEESPLFDVDELQEVGRDVASF